MSGQNKQENKAPLFAFKYIPYDFIKVTAAPGILWFRPKFVYQNEKARERLRGGALLICNHIGFFDPIYVMVTIWYRRHRFVCHKQFFESKARLFFKAFRCIPIDSANVSTDTIRTIVGCMQNGEIVSIFPEGHINDGGKEMQAFKSGAVLMALKSGKPIVPIYVKKKEKWYERLTAAIGEPIDVKALCGERPTFAKMDEISRLLYDRENQLKEMLDRSEQDHSENGGNKK